MVDGVVSHSELERLVPSSHNREFLRGYCAGIASRVLGNADDIFEVAINMLRDGKSFYAVILELEIYHA